MTDVAKTMAVPQKNITSTELKSVDDFFACYARWSCAIHTPVSMHCYNTLVKVRVWTKGKTIQRVQSIHLAVLKATCLLYVVPTQ